MEKKYPKILIVGQSFSLLSGGGITMTNLFKGWKKENIAVAAEIIDNVDLSVCEIYYQLGYNENKKRFPFNIIEKKHPSGLRNFSQSNQSQIRNTNNRNKLILSKLYNYILHFSGLFQYSRNLRLTKEFNNWLNYYEPDIIYSQLSTLALIRFLTKLKNKINKPTVIHMMDDWPSTISKPGLFHKYWKRKIDKEFRYLLNISDLRLGICEAMCEEYKYRYNKEFFPFHNPIELDKWNDLKHKSFNPKDIIILYTGRIGLGIEKSLEETAIAIKNINRGKKFYITLILQTKTDVPWIDKYNFIKQRFIKDYNLYPQSLADADILLLPYDFSESSIKFIRYSFPTKASEYMISGTPILVHASEETAICKHAIKYNWAYVLSNNNLMEIEKSIVQLIENENLRNVISNNAKSFASENFNAAKIKIEFKEKLTSCIKSNFIF